MMGGHCLNGIRSESERKRLGLQTDSEPRAQTLYQLHATLLNSTPRNPTPRPISSPDLVDVETSRVQVQKPTREASGPELRR